MDLYVEPFSGLSGDMFLGALSALSDGYDRLEQLPQALGLDDARVEIEPVTKNGIRCRHVRVIDLGAEHGHASHHRHGPERRLEGLLHIINHAGISAGAKSVASQILTSLAEAEAEVHGISIQEVHFHEVGAVDSLIDIVGSAVLLDLLGIERAYSDPVCTGFGTVHTQHGLLPIPAPATAALLRGMPTYKGDEPGERVTPTGAAILRYLAPSFQPPPLNASAIGYGPGQREFKGPNVLRLSLVEPAGATSSAPTLCVVECNIDDAPAEFLGGDLQDDLKACGAVDVYLTPTQMKKGRPGIMLTVLSPPNRLDAVTDWLLENTSTIGVRWHEVRRKELPRRTTRIETPYGPVEIKEVKTPSGSRRVKIAYDSIRRVSRQRGISLRQAHEELLVLVAEHVNVDDAEPPHAAPLHRISSLEEGARHRDEVESP
jgi:uncharacterized protein (TIGR00299 family) protein